ncbi:RecT family recombinase [Paenibacillus sedimenti]|uniref:Recombinase RecT n=1 Tax=Paenibacillus sedimenti TaxID=2770274 RepID=A0A926QK91_9BACL|nr:RecT family recombinase [Paenibacillus sedimenti]MBD0381237.1 recombinase RecT [Paenibacillus sedimenti]
MTTQITTVGNWTAEDITTMKETLAVGTTDSQFQLFLRTAHASGLNPFLNHIYAITYQGKMSLQIGIEGIAYLAKQKDGYQGYDVQVVYEGELFKPKRAKDGTWEIEHEPDGFPNADAKILGAYAVAYREGFKPYTVIMPFSEVEHFQKSSIPNQQTMWKRYTADMFKKHVLKRALKGQFGIDINEDDVTLSPSASTQDNGEPMRRDITSEATHSDAKFKPAEHEQPKPDPKEKARADIKLKLAQLGLTTVPAIDGFFQTNQVRYDDPKNPTLKELQGVIKLLDLKLAEKENADNDELPIED